MNVGHLMAVFAVVAAAELPDKTFIASLVLGSRYRALPVWGGVVSAFSVHVAIAVSAGTAFSLLPHRLVEAVVALLFAGGGVFCLAIPEEEEEHKGESAATRVSPPEQTATSVFTTAFIVIFVAEWGDLTQILIANLAAKYHDLLTTGVGAFLALSTVAAIAVASGNRLTRVVPLRLVRRVTGVVLLSLAVVTVVQLVR